MDHNGPVLHLNLCSDNLHKVDDRRGRLWHPMVGPGGELEVSNMPHFLPTLKSGRQGDREIDGIGMGRWYGMKDC